MNRSKRCIFICCCLLAQGIRATGIVRKFPAVVDPVIQYLTGKNINIFQMPCPELQYDTLKRKPHGKGYYDRPQNRAICQRISEEIADQMAILIIGGYTIEAVIGIDFSPSCAVKRLSDRQQDQLKKEGGIFIEELKAMLSKKGLRIPFLGIQIYRLEESMIELKNLIER